jgi:hypothetical protein
MVAADVLTIAAGIIRAAMAGITLEGMAVHIGVASIVTAELATATECTSDRLVKCLTTEAYFRSTRHCGTAQAGPVNLPKVNSRLTGFRDYVLDPDLS